ncbi:MAG: hypothetical protein IIB41_03145, partial [Candidatus Marinimicrobia bacterium]|nr:hypothetical protein [Candidatus Neomarinimicrobiota bacterium]
MTIFHHLLFTLLLLIAIIGCDSNIFENKIDTILVPVDNVKFLSVSSSGISDSTWTKSPKRDKPRRLFIGGFEGYESAALFRFGKLSALPPDSLIDSLSVQLTVRNTIGSDQPSSSILISMYKNRVEWFQDSLVTRRLEDFVPLQEDLIDTTTVLWLESDSETVSFSFDIPLSLVQSWDDSSDTNGVIIISEMSSNFIISSLFPSLQISYQDSDTTKTENILTTSAGYLLSITTGLPLSDPERTYIGGGEAYRGIYRFNSDFLNSISVTSKISRAELNISIDDSRSILPDINSSVTGIGLNLYFSYLDLSSESSSLFPTPISDSALANIPTDGNILSIDMTNILQRWVSDNIEERGLVIWSGSEESHLFRVALYKEGCD